MHDSVSSSPLPDCAVYRMGLYSSPESSKCIVRHIPNVGKFQPCNNGGGVTTVSPMLEACSNATSNDAQNVNDDRNNGDAGMDAQYYFYLANDDWRLESGALDDNIGAYVTRSIT